MTAPSGSTVIGPLRALALVVPHFFWAIAFYVMVFLISGIPSAAFVFVVLKIIPADAVGSFDLHSLAKAIAQVIISIPLNVSLIVATYAVALRTGVRVNDVGDLRAVFE